MKEWFYTVTESMVEDLGLRGTELNLFAIIFGYSMKGDGCCYASRQELAKRCGVSSLRTIDAAIDSLQKKGLIEKMIVQKDGHKITALSYSPKGAKNAHTTVQKLHIPLCKNCTPPRAKIAHMENKDKNITITTYVEQEDARKTPTVEEVINYVRTLVKDPEGFAHYYCTEMEGKGWTCGKDNKPVKNWKSNVHQWIKYHRDEDFSHYLPLEAKKEKELHTMSDADFNAMIR